MNMKKLMLFTVPALVSGLSQARVVEIVRTNVAETNWNWSGKDGDGLFSTVRN